MEASVTVQGYRNSLVILLKGLPIVEFATKKGNVAKKGIDFKK